jgi:hypothetical protein
VSALAVTLPEGIDAAQALEELTELLAISDTLAAAEVTVSSEPTILDAWFKLPPTDSQRQRVLLYLLRGPATRDDIAQALSIPDSATDARVIELRHGGWVAETDEKRVTVAGGNAAVLVATDKARKACRLATLSWFPGGIRPETCK